MIETRIHIIENTMPLLEGAVAKFYSVLELPVWIGDDKNGFQPRFQSSNSDHFLLLMAVKIMSTLNAILCLIKNGYVQEVGVLLRVVDECVSKISCIEEAHNKGILNSEQKKIVDEYFKYDFRNIEDLMAANKYWPSIKRVIASQARLLSDGTDNKDVHNIQRIIQTIYDGHSGYVHGLYPQIMELYDQNIKSFRLDGMSGTPRINEMIGAVSSSILRTFNAFAQIAKRLKLLSLLDELIKNKNIFMASEAYKAKSV